MAVTFARIRSELSRAIQRVSTPSFAAYPVKSASRTSPATPAGLTDWRMRQMMLDGTVYLPANRGGARMHVLEMLGKPASVDDEALWPITGYFQPVRPIVDFYGHAFGGTWGKDLLVERPDDLGGGDVPGVVSDALARVARWSNLDSLAAELTEYAANQGTVGIRIVHKLGPDGGVTLAEGARIYLCLDNPEWIADAEDDGRGNVRWVLLKSPAYLKLAPDASEQAYERVELIGKDESVYEVGDESAREENPLGLCPYVVLRFRPGKDRDGNPTFFGHHAYHGSESAIHGINWGLSQLDESTWQHIFPQWFLGGAGNKPDELNYSKLTALYVKLSADAPKPFAQALVPDIKLLDSVTVVKNNIDLLIDRQPELVLNNIRLLSGLSGETLQQARIAAEARAERARVRIEEAVVRAMQIALSIGVFYRFWDLGTGMGTREAAEAAFDDGQGPEAFRFTDRPLLPLTPAARMSEAQAKAAEIQAEAADQRQQVMRDDPTLVKTMVKGQAEAAGLAGSFAGGKDEAA